MARRGATPSGAFRNTPFGSPSTTHQSGPSGGGYSPGDEASHLQAIYQSAAIMQIT